MIRVLIVFLLVLLAAFVVWRMTRETPAQKSARLLREQEAEQALDERRQTHWERMASEEERKRLR